MSEIRCPVCGNFFDPAHSLSMPFCGPRCKSIDLGRWLDERYGLPFERPEAPEGEPESLN